MNNSENPLDRTIERIEANGWIYFTKREYHVGHGDLYKVRPDGTELTLLHSGLCDRLTIIGDSLCYTLYIENEREGYPGESKFRSIPLEEEKAASIKATIFSCIMSFFKRIKNILGKLCKLKNPTA